MEVVVDFIGFDVMFDLVEFFGEGMDIIYEMLDFFDFDVIFDGVESVCFVFDEYKVDDFGFVIVW